MAHDLRRRVDQDPGTPGPYETVGQRILERAFAPYAVSLGFDSRWRWNVIVSLDRRFAGGATIVWKKETIDDAVREALELWGGARAWVIDRVEDACGASQTTRRSDA